MDAIPEGPLRERVPDTLVLVGRLLHQGPKSRDKIYALHGPEVDSSPARPPRWPSWTADRRWR